MLFFASHEREEKEAEECHVSGDVRHSSEPMQNMDKEIDFYNGYCYNMLVL